MLSYATSGRESLQVPQGHPGEAAYGIEPSTGETWSPLPGTSKIRALGRILVPKGCPESKSSVSPA
jgi:hypothetical protein